MTRRLYVSDVHLNPGDAPRLAAFKALLLRARDEVEEVYVLGDLCEMWIGDDDDSTLVHELGEVFATLSSRVDLTFIAGNRDFLLGQDFARRTGMAIQPDPLRLADGTLLAHGDALCTDDVPYQQLRTLLRSADWQADILGKSLAQRREFGAGLREQSRAANANKTGNIMDVNTAAVEQLLAEHTSTLLIHGHTHRPAVHRLPRGARRIVLGAWERCGWWAVQDGKEVWLKCASIEQLGHQAGKSGSSFSL